MLGGGCVLRARPQGTLFELPSCGRPLDMDIIHCCPIEAILSPKTEVGGAAPQRCISAMSYREAESGAARCEYKKSGG